MTNPDLQLPPILIAKQQRHHGEAGRRWLESLPALAREMTQRWQLTLEPPFTAGQVDYTAPARRADGTAVVLKLCYLDEEFYSGAAALRAFDGNAAVRLLDADLANGALLLERLVPGEMLDTLTDDTAAMHEAAGILRQLWQAPTDGYEFLSLEPWLDDANRLDSLPATKRSQPWVEKTLSEAREIAYSSSEQRLLHGDLHQYNVLSSQRGWLAIDPKGIAGDPAWDLAPLLFNHLDAVGNDWPALVRRRIDQLCDELPLDRRRAYALSAARALQSRFWSLREGTEPENAYIERAYHVAEELAKGP